MSLKIPPYYRQRLECSSDTPIEGHISTLPPEMLLKIFYLLRFCYLREVMFVSKEWFNLAHDSSLFWKKVVEAKFGENALYYFAPSAAAGKATWEQVARQVSCSFIRFLDNIRLDSCLVGYTSNTVTVSDLTWVDTFHILFYGPWQFTIDSDGKKILIENKEKHTQHVFHHPNEEIFTHLAQESDFLFAFDRVGRVYQIDFKKNQLVQILETSFSKPEEPMQHQLRDRGASSYQHSLIYNQDYNPHFTATGGFLTLCYSANIDVIDYQNNKKKCFKRGFHQFFNCAGKGLFISYQSSTICSQFDVKSGTIFENQKLPLYENESVYQVEIVEDSLLYVAEENTFSVLKIDSDQIKCVNRVEEGGRNIAILEDFIVLLSGDENAIFFLNRNNLKRLATVSNPVDSKTHELSETVLETFFALISSEDISGFKKSSEDGGG